MVFDWDPTLIHLGPLEIRYYGLLFGLAFVTAYFFLVYFWNNEGWPLEEVDVLVIYEALAVVLGWLVPQGWALFESLQDRLPGLGAIVLGLVLLALAQLISLAKAGLLPERFTPWKPQVHELID